MNYKTLLMASAAVLFSTQAMAQDLTGAFSVPGKGQIMSDTSFEIGREKTKWKGAPGSDRAYDSAIAAEILEYGITDNLSINGGIANSFDVEGEYNNSHNFAYELGAKYNMRFDDVLFQIAGEYNTLQPTTWFGHNPEVPNKWQKNIGLDLKAGLDLGNGITPYIVYSIDSDIDTGHRELDQSISFGIHKYAGKWAVDGAIRYEWTKNDHLSDGYNTGKNETATWFDAEADYYLKDNIALGIYGSYLIDAHDELDGNDGTKYHVKESHEVGLRVKVLF